MSHEGTTLRFRVSRGETVSRHGFRANTEEDQERLAVWLATELCPVELSRDQLAAAVVARCRNDHVEPPAPGQVKRLVGKAVKEFEARFCRSTLDRLSHATRSRLEDLIAGDTDGEFTAYPRTHTYGCVSFRKSHLAMTSGVAGRGGTDPA
ncbi:hypothetical protein [Streptomyces colonosanans]|uniref:DUF4158 domain-containing protein n=1 Tax=Streptomyces colonosanans TaxID=1428652 RepID=A0A1S2PBU3_9ACTN|nr:hypothetical protein [Streptomyces colonosanans]OIJ91221.1 hypothetical protein BIV24_16700 [Streptomyces colonosanans]